MEHYKGSSLDDGGDEDVLGGSIEVLLVYAAGRLENAHITFF